MTENGSDAVPQTSHPWAGEIGESTQARAHIVACLPVCLDTVPESPNGRSDGYQDRIRVSLDPGGIWVTPDTLC
jgi:hypothetical protein